MFNGFSKILFRIRIVFPQLFTQHRNFTGFIRLRNFYLLSTTPYTMERETKDMTIDNQIEKGKDLDSKTSKPQLNVTKSEKSVKRTQATKQNVSTSLFIILIPYLRNLSVGKNERDKLCNHQHPIICHLLDA